MARVLVIEDNAANRELMIYLLGAFGHSTVACEDGIEGMATAQRSTPDLIICDVHLPGLDGYEVAHRLRADPQRNGIPLVAVTALAMVGDSDKVLAAGFDGYISKPIDPYTFVAQVEAFLPAVQRSGMAPCAGAKPDAADPVARASRQATILAVDDSATNRDLLRSILAPFGYTVIGVRSVAGALTVARRVRPDLILSDLRMPDEDGFEFVRQLRADPELRSVPCVILTASVWKEGDRRRLLRLGADRFLQRPIEPRDLLTAVEECLSPQLSS
jgi:two-component system, cell cycle response regulator